MIWEGISLSCYFSSARVPFLRHLVEHDLVDFDKMCADSVVQETGRELHIDELGVVWHFILVVEHHVSVIMHSHLLDDHGCEKHCIDESEIIQRTVLVSSHASNQFPLTVRRRAL